MEHVFPFKNKSSFASLGVAGESSLSSFLSGCFRAVQEEET